VNVDVSRGLHEPTRPGTRPAKARCGFEKRSLEPAERGQEVVMGLFGLFGGSNRLSREEIRARVAAGAVLVDVRTPAEFESGHASGARNVPLQDLPRRVGELPRDREVIVYCRSGGRSANAHAILRAQGFERVVDAGGLTNVM
jgi:phage shock protein E